MTRILCALAALGWAALAMPACSSDDPAPPGPEADAAAEADADLVGCGRLSTPCPAGGACEGAQDCETGSCRDGTCRAILPTDGVKNGTETDIDCGGPSAVACADGKQCLVAADCTSTVCTGGVCQAPSPTDGVQNGDETDVDCGGAVAPKCVTGQGCAGDADCNLVRCDLAAKKCAAPNDGDGIKNGDETGIDCGGPTTAKKCPTGEGCTQTSDCDKSLCNDTTKVCDPPSPTDNIQNGDESDVDCGGTGGAIRCVEGRVCAVDADCTDFCAASLRCVTGRSCKTAATSGIVTCGAGETAEVGKVHESCCRSLPLPTTPTVRLDKYEVTSGRFRQFIETVGPNIRAWAAKEIADNTPTGQRLAADVPASMRNLFPSTDEPGVPLNLVMQVGGTVMDSRVPSTSQGCYNGAGSSGHNTYWWPRETLQAHFGAAHIARRWTKEQYDEKSMNCSPYWMYAAFCAWDGGRLPTMAEITQVWTATYPWGASYATPPVVPNGPPRAPGMGFDYTETVNQNNNNNFFYHFPGYGDANDLTGYIAAPGRFFRDATSAKSAGQSWMDLAANHFEMVKHAASGNGTFCDFNVFFGDTTSASCVDGGQQGVIRATGMPNVQWVGGSWEGHGIGRTGSTQQAQTQYGKTGVRCARLVPPTP